MLWSSLIRSVMPMLALLGALFLLLDTRNMIAEFDPLSQLESLKDEPRTYQILDMEKEKGDENLADMDGIREMNRGALPARNTNLRADELCTGNTSSNYCMPALKNFETELRSAPKYKISTCVVQKSLSTVMTAVFCFLFNEKSFVAANRNMLKEWKQLRFCANENEFISIPQMHRILKAHSVSSGRDGWTYSMVTREPVDRFLSGFVDKCIRKPLPGEYCNGCKSNMTCFLIKEYDRIQMQLDQGKFWKSFEDRHFFPQNWRCGLSSFLNKYQFIRYSTDPSTTLLTDLTRILRKQNVPRTAIKYIETQLTTGRTAHSTVASEARKYLEYRLRSSAFLMEYVVRIFYHDFRLLHYPFPEGF